MPTNAVADLVEVLGQHRLVDSSQLNLIKALQARFSDPRALCKELVQRGLLTSYQTTQLLQGRGSELLLGSYLILDLLGEGGMGQVFKARHMTMNRIVALKVLRKELLDDQEVVGRFYREIEVASQISHPNIVHAYDAGPIGKSLVLAMEYVDGIDLEKLVKESGKLPVAQACDYIVQAAQGLQHAHGRGLIHRDIKPSNLLVASGGRKSAEAPGANAPGSPAIIKILDLGLARLAHPGRASATRNLTLLAGGSVMQGTPDYMAPEQAVDFHSADTRADIYSLGCTFYFLLAGQPPFASGTLPEKLLKHQTAEPPPLAGFRKDVPPAVAEILRKMLAKRPADRFQVPGAVAQALAPLVAFRKKSGFKPVDGAAPSSASGDKLPAVRQDTRVKPGQRHSKVDVPPKKASSGRLATFQKAQRRRWFAITFGGGLALVAFLAVFVFLLTRSAEPQTVLATGDASTRLKDLPTNIVISTKPQIKTSPGKEFDGKKDFIEIKHRDDLEPPQLTVECWLNPSSIPVADEIRRWIVNKNTHEHAEGHYALVIKGQKVGAYINIGDGEANRREAWSAGDVLREGTWQHLAMTYDGFGMRVYFNGSEVALAVVDKPRKASTKALVIGRRQDGYEKSYFHGRIDDVRIYNRVLTEQELKVHWLRPDAPPDKPEKGLVFQQRF